MTYLLALHEHQHFGRAAVACRVTQSTLSVGIAELERQLAAVLVERSKRNLRFTEMGEEVVVRAGGIIRAAEDLCTVAQRAREPLIGTLSMAVIPTIAPFLLPSMLTVIGERWPRLKLFAREMLTAPACIALERGTIDCVLLALPIDCGDVEVCEILTDRLLLAVCQTENASTAPILLDEIDPSRLLLLEDGHCLKDHALAACDLSTPDSEPRLVASTLQTLVQLVDAGLGMTLLPEIAVREGILAGTSVNPHVLADVRAERQIALVWRRNHPRHRDFMLLGETIRSAAHVQTPTQDSAV